MPINVTAVHLLTVQVWNAWCPHSQHNTWRTLGRYKLLLQICNIYSVRRPICHVQGLFHFVYSIVWPAVKLHLKWSPRSCPKFYNLPKLNASARNCGTHWILKIYSLEVLFYPNVFLSWDLTCTTIKYTYNTASRHYTKCFIYIISFIPYNPIRQWLLLFIV